MWRSHSLIDDSAPLWQQRASEHATWQVGNCVSFWQQSKLQPVCLLAIRKQCLIACQPGNLIYGDDLRCSWPSLVYCPGVLEHSNIVICVFRNYIYSYTVKEISWHLSVERHLTGTKRELSGWNLSQNVASFIELVAQSSCGRHCVFSIASNLNLFISECFAVVLLWNTWACCSVWVYVGALCDGPTCSLLCSTCW